SYCARARHHLHSFPTRRSSDLRIPFTGEPLKGLQVMGVLESRNLDFTNVFILSLNEGAFPAFGSKGSYIPHSIRKAYGLPTTDQDRKSTRLNSSHVKNSYAVLC